MMKTVNAYMNHGRWIVNCPKHGTAGAVEVDENETEYIAPCCYPKSMAMFLGMSKGQPKTIPDTSARATARAMAKANDEIYTIIFPAKITEIKAIMDARPIHNRHWTTETIAALKKENKAHGVK
jgi:hypothetical protein